MDVAALEAALPAALVSALTLLSANSQVFVQDAQPTADVATSPQCWVRLVGMDVSGMNLDRSVQRWTYDLTLYASGMTAAQRVTAMGELISNVHGQKVPSGITRHSHTEVQGSTNPLPDVGPSGALRCQLVFVGDGEEDE